MTGYAGEITSSVCNQPRSAGGIVRGLGSSKSIVGRPSATAHPLREWRGRPASPAPVPRSCREPAAPLAAEGRASQSKMRASRSMTDPIKRGAADQAVSSADRRRLQLSDRPSYPHPHELPIAVAALQHEIGSLPRSLNLGVGTVPPDQQIGGSPYVEFGDHDGHH